jgi:lysophospholipase L1-like esterase
MRAVPVAMILGVCLAATASGPLTASDGRDGRDDRNQPYLALGDSVPFGFMPLPGFEAVNASNFVGYADVVGRELDLTTVNGSCPGETSGSFLDSFISDNGCLAFRFDPRQLPAREARFPLHTAYESTQGAFAVDFVKANPRTRLVTIQLGANDLFLLAGRCVDVGRPLEECLNERNVGLTLLNVEQNVLAVISNLRAAGYRRQIVIINYYPLDLNDQLFTGVIRGLNLALADAAARGGAIVADTFTPFERAAMAPFAAMSPCRAGLLKANPLSDPLKEPTCDVHPSQSGHQLIATAIVRALRKAAHD